MPESNNMAGDDVENLAFGEAKIKETGVLLLGEMSGRMFSGSAGMDWLITCMPESGSGDFKLPAGYRPHVARPAGCRVYAGTQYLELQENKLYRLIAQLAETTLSNGAIVIISSADLVWNMSMALG